MIELEFSCIMKGVEYMNKLRRYNLLGISIIIFLLVSFQRYPSDSSLVNITKSILLIVVGLLLVVSNLTKSTNDED